MKLIHTMPIALLGLFTAAASAEPVLAPVVESIGSVSGSSKAGGTLATGASINTNASSRITLNPFPGAVISFGAKTQAMITKLEMSKQGDAVTRGAAVQLKQGSAMFAVSKVNWAATQCQIISAKGSIAAERPQAAEKTASASLVSIHGGVEKVAVLTGASSYTLPSGQKIALAGGHVLSNGENGLSVVDLAAGKETSYDETGTAMETHEASTEAMKAASSSYGEGAAHSQALVAAGAVSSEVASAVTETLASVNQKLAEKGVDPVSAEQVGSLPTAPSGESGGSALAPANLPSLAGMGGGGSANPANTKGIVRSSEK